MKRLVRLVVAAMMILVVTACGGGTASAPAPAPGNNVPANNALAVKYLDIWVSTSAVGVLENGLIMLSVPYYTVNIFKGAVLAVALALIT